MTFHSLKPKTEYLPDTYWHEVGGSGEPAFIGSWTNYGGGFDTAAFRMTADGWVYMKGLVKSGSGTLFTLPEGYRPALDVYLPQINANAPGYVNINPNGNVTIGIPTGSSSFCSMNVRFPVVPLGEYEGRYSVLHGMGLRPGYTEFPFGTFKRDNGFVEVLGTASASVGGVSKIWVPPEFMCSSMNVVTDSSADAKRFDVKPSEAGYNYTTTSLWSIIQGEYGTLSTEDQWVTATLENSWAGGTTNALDRWPPAQYRKDKYGIVHLRGLVLSGSSAAANIFTLPSGYRPAATLLFPRPTTSGTGVCRVDVTSTGGVAATNNGSTTWNSLDGIAVYPG